MKEKTKYFIILLIITPLLFFVIFQIGKGVLTDINIRKSLKNDGIEVMAVVTNLSFGGGQSGRNYIYYKFSDQDNNLVKSRGEVGYKLSHSVKRNDIIMIIYSSANPEINSIKDNNSTRYVKWGFLIFFIVGTCLLFYAIIYNIKKLQLNES